MSRYLTRAFWRTKLAERTQARYTTLSAQAKDTASVARLLNQLLAEVPASLLDTTPVMVLMSHQMILPAPTVVHAIEQLDSMQAIAHAASLGTIKEKSYITLAPVPTQDVLEQFFRNRQGAYVNVAELFAALHQRLTLLIATILGEDTTDLALSAYQQRTFYPLLDCYRTWFLTLYRLRTVLDPRSI